MIPTYEISSIDLNKVKIYKFENGIPILVPRRIPYAFVLKEEEFYGIAISRNGRKGFKIDDEEKIFVRTCPKFVGRMICKTENCIEAII